MCSAHTIQFLAACCQRDGVAQELSIQYMEAETSTWVTISPAKGTVLFVGMVEFAGGARQRLLCKRPG